MLQQNVVYTNFNIGGLKPSNPSSLDYAAERLESPGADLSRGTSSSQVVSSIVIGTIDIRLYRPRCRVKCTRPCRGIAVTRLGGYVGRIEISIWPTMVLSHMLHFVFFFLIARFKPFVFFYWRSIRFDVVPFINYRSG